MGLAPVLVVLQLCVQLLSEVTAWRGWCPFHTLLPPQEPRGDAVPWPVLPAPAPCSRRDAVPWPAGWDSEWFAGQRQPTMHAVE